MSLTGHDRIYRNTGGMTSQQPWAPVLTLAYRVPGAPSHRHRTSSAAHIILASSITTGSQVSILTSTTTKNTSCWALTTLCLI